MKQEYTLILIVGLLILAYVLDAVVNPLTVKLPTPYHFFTPGTMSTYPFTTASIIIKATAVFIAPLWFLSFTELSKKIKGSTLLVLGGLMQLYSLQAVVTNSKIIPLEWLLSLALAGALLLIPAFLYLLAGLFGEERVKPLGMFDDEEEI